MWAMCLLWFNFTTLDIIDHISLKESDMIYYEKGSKTTALTASNLKKGMFEALDKIGKKQKVLAIPPDYTRLPSRAGELTEFTWQYFGEKLTDILPALGTHTPMTDKQISHMFGNTPRDLFRDHDW